MSKPSGSVENAARVLGSRGGKTKTPEKAKSSRENGRQHTGGKKSSDKK